MSWKREVSDGASPDVAAQTLGISEAFNIHITKRYEPGDYLYRSGSLKRDLESGMWGIFRVLKKGVGCKCKNICRRVMDCIGK